MPLGLGAERGLRPLEHVAVSLQAEHPSEGRKELPEVLQSAIDFECELAAAEVDAFRLSLLKR